LADFILCVEADFSGGGKIWTFVALFFVPLCFAWTTQEILLGKQVMKSSVMSGCRTANRYTHCHGVKHHYVVYNTFRSLKIH